MVPTPVYNSPLQIPEPSEGRDLPSPLSGAFTRNWEQQKKIWIDLIFHSNEVKEDFLSRSASLGLGNNTVSVSRIPAIQDTHLTLRITAKWEHMNEVFCVLFTIYPKLGPYLLQ